MSAALRRPNLFDSARRSGTNRSARNPDHRGHTRRSPAEVLEAQNQHARHAQRLAQIARTGAAQTVRARASPPDACCLRRGAMELRAADLARRRSRQRPTATDGMPSSDKRHHRQPDVSVDQVSGCGGHPRHRDRIAQNENRIGPCRRSARVNQLVSRISIDGKMRPPAARQLSAADRRQAASSCG